MNTPLTNIDLFNKVVAATLVLLYESFPNPMRLDAAKIGMTIASDDDEKEEIFRLISETAENSIAFLVREGFVRYDKQFVTLSDVGVFPEATLTLKGFTLLGSVPEAVDEAKDRRPYIERLRSATASGVREAIPEVIKSMFKTAMRAGLTVSGIA